MTDNDPEHMMPKQLAVAALGMWAALAVLDAVWLGSMAGLFYRPQLAGLMADDLVWWAAILFYLLYGAGVTLFVLRPAIAAGRSPGVTMLHGAAFGLVAYGTYDLTSQTVLRDWPVIVTIVDMLWGAVLTALASGFGLWLGRRAGR